MITVSNHVFMWDFLCVMRAIRPRLARFPAWKENLDGNLRWLIRWAGGIPIPTDSFSAMKQFKAAMEKENVTYEEIYDMVAEKRKLSEEENAAKKARDEEERKKKEMRHDERDKDYREQLRRDFKAELKNEDPAKEEDKAKTESANEDPTPPVDTEEYRERLRREFGANDSDDQDNQ